MAIKAGQIIHAGNGTTVIDRIQSGGPGQLNVPTEKIYELGNYKSVATIRDTPDLTFSFETFDMSTEPEAFLAGAYAGRTVDDAITIATEDVVSSANANFTVADVGRIVIIEGAGTGGADFVSTIESVDEESGDGTDATLADPVPTSGTGLTMHITQTDGIDFAEALPVDIASQFKAGQEAVDETLVIASVAAPFLYVESVSYRLGLRDNAAVTANLRGDAIFYNPGATLFQTAAGTNTPGQTVITAQSAYQTAENDGRRVLAVTVGKTRLNFGADYTESYGSVTNGAAVTTITITDAVPTTETIRIIYSSPATVQYPQGVHPSATVKPAAIKGRDIEVYVGGYNPNDIAASQVNKITSIQSVNVDWRVTVEKDEEFGNHYAVGLDFDVPQVSGSIDIKPRDAAELMSTLRLIQGVDDQYKSLGPTKTTPLDLDIVFLHPDTGAVLKRLSAPDVRFTLPGFQGRVQQKTTVSLPFESDEGDFKVYRF